MRRRIRIISRELDRLSVLQALKNKQIKVTQAAESMRVSVRHAYRLKITLLKKVADCTVLPKLIEKSPKTVQKICADGAYDRLSCRKYLFEKGLLHGCIPPRTHGKMKEEVELESRNDSLKIIRNLGIEEEAFYFGKNL